jgi:hypothetical protein
MEVDSIPHLEKIEEQREQGVATSSSTETQHSTHSKRTQKQQSLYLRRRKQFLHYLKEVPAYQLLELEHKDSSLTDRLVNFEFIVVD